MKKTLLALGLLALVGLLTAPLASAHDGRDPEDNFEFEGHFGFYWNLRFPTDVNENPAYTTFLNDTTNPDFHALFRPQIRSKDFRWHWGLRISGDVSPRFSLEYTFEASQGDNFRFNREYLDTVLPERLAAVPTLRVRRLREAGHILLHHGNLVFHTRATGRLIPYVTGGLTVIQYGEGPLIDLHFDDASDETDVFGYEHRHTKVGGNAGGGIKYYATRHVGVRADARFVLTPSRFTQRGAIIRPAIMDPAFTFGPDVTQNQRGLYSNLHISFGLFGRF